MCQERVARTGLSLAQDHHGVARLERVKARRSAIQTDQRAWRRNDVPLATADAHHIEAIAEHGPDRAGEAALGHHFLRGGRARRW